MFIHKFGEELFPGVEVQLCVYGSSTTLLAQLCFFRQTAFLYLPVSVAGLCDLSLYFVYMFDVCV